MQQNMASQGFYVFQTALGAPLEFHPALGTAELDEMVDAYVIGAAAIQDKRAAVSMDFFNHFSLTGETIKFYPVSVFTSTSTTSSPASMYDSGYGSSFSASPIAPTWNWGQAASASAPASVPEATSRSPKPLTQSRRHQTPLRNVSVAPSRQASTDFSHRPGMKILTKDGRDVTNAVSRGCKTKEQRDHAHLMRIMKACDACKKKKIRCDPSHKTREASKATKASKARAQVISKASTNEVAAQRPLPETPGSSAYAPGLWIPDLTLPDAPLSEFDHFNPANPTPWEDPLAQLCQDIPDEYDWFNDPNSLFSPVSGTSSTPMSQPFTPDSQQSASPESGQDALVPLALADLESRQPTLPYLDNSGPPHNYVDFNLYSPAQSFSDEEPPVFAGDLSGDRDESVLQQGKPGGDTSGICGGSEEGKTTSAIHSPPAGPLSDWPRLDSGHDHTQSVVSPDQTYSTPPPTSLATLDPNQVPQQQQPSGLPSTRSILSLAEQDVVTSTTTISMPSTLAGLFESVPSMEDHQPSQTRQTGSLSLSADSTCQATWVEESPTPQPPTRGSLDTGLSIHGNVYTYQQTPALLEPVDRTSHQHASVVLDSRRLTNSLQLLAAVAILNQHREKPTQTSAVLALLQAIVLPLAAAVATAVLLHGIIALEIWPTMAGLQNSISGVALCSVTCVTSRSTNGTFPVQAQVEGGPLAMLRSSLWDNGLERLRKEGQKLGCMMKDWWNHSSGFARGGMPRVGGRISGI